MLSISAAIGSYFSGSAAAASVTAVALARVGADMPTESAIFSLVSPFNASGIFPEAFLPGAVSPCDCLYFAAFRSKGSNALAIATASRGVNSLRQVFSSRSASSAA